MGSSSKASTTTAQTTSNTSTNLNIQDTEGTIGNDVGGDLTIISTDHNAQGEANRLAQGALDVASGLGSDALALSREVSQMTLTGAQRGLETVSDLSRDSLREVSDVTSRALTFGDQAFGLVEKSLSGVSGAYRDSAAYNEKALGQVAAFGTDALEKVQQTNETATNTLATLFRDAFEGVTEFVGNLQGKAQTQLGETVTALNQIARESSKSTDERVAEVAAGSQKTILIVVIVVVIGGVAYAIAKR